MVELLLWQWSSAVQISSTLLIAVFFVVFGRSAGRPELRWWVAAWVANGLALGVTWLFWMFQPGPTLIPFLLGCYFVAKTAFIALLLLGIVGFHRPQVAERALRPVAVAVLVFGIAGALIVDGINLTGVLQSSLIAVVLGAAAVQCLRHRGSGLGWLALVCAMRALLGAAEASGYAWRLLGPEGGVPEQVGLFLAAHSSFDTGAEWVMALGCVLAITHRVHAELERSHQDLNHAHEALREVAERDPLTGLHNRRMLKPLLDAHRDRELELLFFDLDDFKRINDSQGHEVGDACLVRFAEALRRHLHMALGTVRFAGDEFVAFGLPGMAEQGVSAMREDLSHLESGVPALRFSIGRAVLPIGASAEAALREADLAMYRDKANRPDRRQT